MVFKDSLTTLNYLQTSCELMLIGSMNLRKNRLYIDYDLILRPLEHQPDTLRSRLTRSLAGLDPPTSKCTSTGNQVLLIIKYIEMMFSRFWDTCVIMFKIL